LSDIIFFYLVHFKCKASVTLYRSFYNFSVVLNTFPSLIPFKYVSSNNKPINIYFTLYDLNNLDKFTNIIQSNISKNTIYTVFKVKTLNNHMRIRKDI